VNPASFACKYEGGVAAGGGGGGSGSATSASSYLINEHGMLMAHEFGPNVASVAATAAVAAAAAAAAVANASAGNGSGNGGQDPGGSGSGAPADYPDIKLEDYDAAELRLTNEELSQWQDVIKMDDYLAKGRRPQFWEEPFTKRVSFSEVFWWL